VPSVADAVKAFFEAVKSGPDSIDAFWKVYRRVKRKRRLRRALQRDDMKWRKLSTLALLIGQTEQETRELLIELDARPSVKPGAVEELWGLPSRVGEG
jgi:hypothetical protein